MPNTNEDSTEQLPDEQNAEQLPEDATTEDEESPNEGEESTEEKEPETFSREYVHKLRQEMGAFRLRAKDRDTVAERADGLAQRLHTELVRASGRLADPADLPFDESHIDDPEALKSAIDDLLTRKPHLASRTPAGDIGQGVGDDPSDVNLLDILRMNS